MLSDDEQTSQADDQSLQTDIQASISKQSNEQTLQANDKTSLDDDQAFHADQQV